MSLKQWWVPAAGLRWNCRGSFWLPQSRAAAGQRVHGWEVPQWQTQCTSPTDRPLLPGPSSPRFSLQSETGFRQGHTWAERQFRHLRMEVNCSTCRIMTCHKFYMRSCKCAFTDQMIMATSLMMASFKQSKKSLRAWPCCFMLPITRPKHMEKTTRPRAFTPPEEPDTGTVSFTVSCEMENHNLVNRIYKYSWVWVRSSVCLPVWCAAPCWSLWSY